MKYISVFVTILLIWLAVILMAIARKSSVDAFLLYVSVMISTVALFLIGFSRK